ncbi:MAG: peptidylprolyl isomerase [Propionibacteriaceae bacterium]|jgi:peptidyl-prolyl cis-trans isomerase B (cyclophilin B)|nr:peptidylprolyl isomerase [Propionibacteriaceae bacterium]
MRIRTLFLGVTLMVVALITGCSFDKPTSDSTNTATTTSTTTTNPGVTSCSYLIAGEPARAVQQPNGDNVPTIGTVQFTIHFEAGDVTLTMDRALTPCTVNSFESLVAQGFYDDTVCHRTFANTMFQCGDPSGTGMGGPGYFYADEISPDTTSVYPRGVVAMANAGADTNGSQFFLVYQELPLDGPKYAIFATMDDQSMQVLETLNQIGVSPDDPYAPAQPIRITSVTKS